MHLAGDPDRGDGRAASGLKRGASCRDRRLPPGAGLLLREERLGSEDGVMR